MADDDAPSTNSKYHSLTITPRHKLTASQTSTLRTALLRRALNYDPTNSTPSQQDDATDLLDYALAMLGNGKSVGFVVEEMVGMELEVCDDAAGERIALELGRFIRGLDGDDDDDDDGH